MEECDGAQGEEGDVDEEGGEESEEDAVPVGGGGEATAGGADGKHFGKEGRDGRRGQRAGPTRKGPQYWRSLHHAGTVDTTTAAWHDDGGGDGADMAKMAARRRRRYNGGGDCTKMGAAPARAALIAPRRASARKRECTFAGREQRKDG